MKPRDDVRQLDERDLSIATDHPQLPTTILQLEGDGTVCSASSEVFGLPTTEAIGVRLQDLLTPTSADRLEHAMRCADEGGVFRLTARARRERQTLRLLIARSQESPDTQPLYSVIASPTAARRLRAVSSGPDSPTTDSPAGRSASRRRVLIAEDEPMLLQLSKRVLENAGFETSAVADGDAVLHALRSRDDFGLVVLDLSLPGPSASDLLHQIRSLSTPPLVLVVTGRPPEEVEEVLDGEPMPDHLQKPYSNELLTDTVHRLLES